VTVAPSKVSPLWVRDTMVEDYQNNARKVGVEASSSDVERLVLHDLTLAEAFERETKSAPRAKPAPRTEPSKRAQRMAEETGHVLFRRGLDAAIVTPGQAAAAAVQKRRARRMAFLGRPPKNERQQAIIARLGRILAIRSKFRPSITTDYTIPDLANRWARLMVDLERGRGLFEGKHARDCERIYWAECQDICEKSTGKLGSFWVK
jgi:hypothetical protein